MSLARKSVVCAAALCSMLSLSACSNAPAGDAPDGGALGGVAHNQVGEKPAKKPDEQTLLKELSTQQSILPKNSPQLEAPLEKVASFYEVGNRYDLAEKYLAQMTVCHETNWNWERLSTALAEQGKFDQAIEAMKRSVAMIEAKHKDDNTAAVYIRYAKLLEKAGKQSEAAPCRKKAHELAPNVKNSTLRWH